MKLSDGEKLILMMLSEVHESLKIKDGINPKLVQSALLTGNLWGLRWQYPALFDTKETERETVSEVTDILDMWDIIETSYKKLSPEEKKKVEAEAERFGKDVKFRGFDGNYETEHMSVARFLIDNMERFTVFAGRDLNSHVPSLGGYRRMLRVFSPARSALMSGTLTAASLIEILREQIHPDNRQKSA